MVHKNRNNPPLWTVFLPCMPETTATPGLIRSLTLAQGTAINIIDMVGIGPFITVSLVVSALQGPGCILAWVLGALLAYTDGMVWSELGAKWPEAGGSYVFLHHLFGNGWISRLMPFLFVWQTIIQAPLTMASASIGFSHYLTYLIPLDYYGKKAVSGALVILIVIILYRNIRTVGKISMIFGVITIATLLWIIGSGMIHFNAAQAFHWDFSAFNTHALLFAAMGNATLQAVYSYLGYYNIVHLGGEIKNPRKNIPKSIFLSVTVIAVCYVGMQLALLGNLPFQTIARSDFIISTYFESIYNGKVANVATILILIIASSSLFALTLGYSRVPFAAAKNGDFFPIFGRLHPKHRFPHISLLALGILGFIFSLLFKIKVVIIAIITMRILIQFIGQSVGLLRWHYLQPDDPRPYKMPLFPLPALISMSLWLFILFCSDWQYIAFAFAIIATGICLFFLKEGLFSRSRRPH
jgi:fructoselysine transporter